MRPTKEDFDEMVMLRSAFSTAEGRQAFKWILTNCYMFNMEVTPEYVPLQNFARKLMFRMGFLVGENIDRYTNLVLSLPMPIVLEKQIEDGPDAQFTEPDDLRTALQGDSDE